MSLPITEFLPDIIRTIASSPTSSIISPTGTGKSIAIPTTLAKLNSKVMVAVPTRTAALSLSAYARTFSNNTIDIGSAAEGQINYNPSTQLIYATAGHVRRQLLKYFNNGNATAIDLADILIVDEAHLATIDVSLILDLWQYAYRQGVEVPRLVLTTATPNTLDLQPLPTAYTVTLRTYDISYKYLAADVPKLRLDQLIERMQIEIMKILAETSEGDILAFVPGSRQVDIIVKYLQENTKSDQVLVLAAYSALTSEDLDKIHTRSTLQNAIRKIVIATNIAETAITIDNVAYVIDSMYEKLAETSKAGGFRLATNLISKDSATQRAGRTGRTRPGNCIRLISEGDYQKLPKSRLPEIQRIPIYEILLELLAVGISPDQVLHGVPKNKILNTLHQLQKLNMIDQSRNVTVQGTFAPSYPLSVRNAAVLYQWLEQQFPPFVGIVLVSLIDCYGPSYMYLPRNLQDQAKIEYIAKYFEKYNSPSDLQTAILIWLDLYTFLDGNIYSKRYPQWSKDNSMNNRKIKELLHVIKQCIKITQAKGYSMQLGVFPAERAILRALPILQNVYDDALLIHLSQGTYKSSRNNTRYIMDKDSLTAINKQYPAALLGLVMIEIDTGRGNLNFISFSVNTDLPPTNLPSTNLPSTNLPSTTIASTSERINPPVDLLAGLSIFDENPNLATQDIANQEQVQAIWLQEVPIINTIIDASNSNLLGKLYPQARIIKVNLGSAINILSQILEAAQSFEIDVLYLQPQTQENISSQELVQQTLQTNIKVVVLNVLNNYDQDQLINRLAPDWPEIRINRYDISYDNILYFIYRQ